MRIDFELQMMKSFLFRLLALALVIAVPSLATVAVTHAHSSATSPHDSHWMPGHGFRCVPSGANGK